MLMGLGTDLCAIERIGRAIEKERFLNRVYTEAERQRILAASGARRSEIAAGLFAAKEAVSKALGTGIAGFGFDCVEILPDALGRPVCALSGGALERARLLCPEGFRLWVSVTHEAGMAASSAVLERTKEDCP